MGGDISAVEQERRRAERCDQSSGSLLRGRQRAASQSEGDQGDGEDQRGGRDCQDNHACDREGRERVSERHLRELSDHVGDDVQGVETRPARHTIQDRLE